MDLIKQLKGEHIKILHLFEECSDYAEGKVPNGSNLLSSIRELMDILSEHLKLEDLLLYPTFDNSKDEECNKLGQKFSKEMKEISVKTFSFLKKNSTKKVNYLIENDVFKKEFKEIIQLVGKRVKIEEKILYPAFGS